MNTKGDSFEFLAAQYLRGQGLTIVDRNYRCRCGEIDIIARHGQCLIFVEVRSRRNPRFASAAASVDLRKQRKLIKTAQFYLQQHPGLSTNSCRFDVIAFEPRQSRTEPAPTWIPGAFTI